MLRLIRLLSFTALLCAGTSAHALIALGDITGDPPFHTAVFLTPGATFSETITFSLSAPSAVGAVASGFDIADFNFVSSFGGLGTTFPSGPSATITSFLSILAPGDYSFTLDGSSLAGSGAYALALGAVAVPEPAEWMLFASGLAVVALIARRRKLHE